MSLTQPPTLWVLEEIVECLRLLANLLRDTRISPSRLLQPLSWKYNKAGRVPEKQRIKPTKLPMTTGKLEVTIKINELPNDVQTNKDNWKTFELDCDGRVVSVTVKPKIWKKLEDAAANYPQWVAAIGGKMGESTSDGFVLSEPNIQVFERKPKDPKPEAEQ
jgi:hypothetical protein